MHIVRHPETGSPRHSHKLDMPGLRSWPMARFPYLIFYFEFEDHVRVILVLHEHRDIPAHLLDP